MAPPVASAGETKTAKRIEHFATFKFLVEIEGIAEAVFNECSGLEITTDIMEYQEGGLNEFSHKLPGRTKLSNVTLKRGFAISNELYKWYLGIDKNLREGQAITKRKVTIKLQSTVKTDEEMSWTLNAAFPVRWVGPALNTTEAAVAIETLEFAHHGLMEEIIE